jgi:selT/selW/selH-like putative selenoprotein
VSLATELLSRWAPIMRVVELRSGDRGRFEVSLDGELIFSKAASGRFPAQGEVRQLFEAKLGPPLQWRNA